jgi:NAD-dependent DNA ligase
MGGVFGSAITSKTAYLVVGDTTFQGDPNHKSTKAKKAAALGIPVISESGLISIINKGA